MEIPGFFQNQVLIYIVEALAVVLILWMIREIKRNRASKHEQSEKLTTLINYFEGFPADPSKGIEAKKGLATRIDEMEDFAEEMRDSARRRERDISQIKAELETNGGYSIKDQINQLAKDVEFLKESQEKHHPN